MADGLSQPFHFDVLSQLFNILARITLYELLKMFQETREVLKKALPDAKVLATRETTQPS